MSTPIAAAAQKMKQSAQQTGTRLDSSIILTRGAQGFYLLPRFHKVDVTLILPPPLPAGEVTTDALLNYLEQLEAWVKEYGRVIPAIHEPVKKEIEVRDEEGISLTTHAISGYVLEPLTRARADISIRLDGGSAIIADFPRVDILMPQLVQRVLDSEFQDGFRVDLPSGWATAVDIERLIEGWLPFASKEGNS